MKKRFLSLLLAGAMILALAVVPAAAQGVSVNVSAQGQVVATLQFTLNDDDHTAQLDGAKAGINGMLTVPRSISHQGQEYTVTAIGHLALAGQTGLTQLWLPDTVTGIGNGAFMDCERLLAVGTYDGQGDADPYTLPEGVAVIGDRTFRGCTRLGAVTIPATVEQIGSWAFAYCYSLERVSFAQGSRLSDIHQGSFYYCSSLKELTLPEGLTYLSLDAFSYCGGLKSVTIPAALEEIPAKAFYACSSLETVDFTGDGLTTMGHSAFFWCTKLKTIRTGDRPGLPATLRTIPRWAFYRCDSLAQLDLSGMSALKEIEGYAFNASGVVDLKLPQNLKYIRLLAFEGCKNLKTIDWNRPENDNDLLDVEEKAFASTGLEYVTVPQLTVGTGLEMFYDCDSLTTVSMEPAALFVPDGAFRDCDNLTTVTLGSTLEKVGEQAFYTCPKLTDAGLENATGLKVIGPLAFCRTALPTVTLTGPIEEIGRGAFGINRALTSITVSNLANPGGYFSHGDAGVLYQVKGTDVILVQYPMGWTATTFDVPGGHIVDGKDVSGVTIIGDDAFSHSEHLETITFSTTALKKIGDYAFAHCINLRTANVPEDVTQGVEIFEGSYQMTQITLPPNTTTLDSSSLAVNSKLTTVTLPANVTGISATIPGPFSSLALLKEIRVDDGHPSFKTVDGVLFSKDGTILYAYPRGKADSEYVVPDGVTTIWYSAFSEASNLTRLTFPASVTTVRPSACYEMSNLERLDILRETPDVNTASDGTVAYNGFLTHANEGLQVYVNGDPTDKRGVADWVQDFVTVCGNGSGPDKQNIHVDFYKPATQAGDRFLADGVVYTLLDPAAKTVKVEANAHYEGDSVFIPAQVLYQGTAYTVTEVEPDAFPDNVEVVYRDNLTNLTPSKTTLAYGDVLVVNTPAAVTEGTALTLTAGGKTLTATVEGGAARFPVDKTLADTFGFGTYTVSAAAGDIQAEFSLTLSKKVFTKADLPWHNSTSQKLVIEKPYDGTTTVDYESAALLRDFAANGESLSLHITGTVPETAVSTILHAIDGLKLEFVGDTADHYLIAEDIDVELGDNGGQKGHNILAEVTYGQLYLKEIDGTLQQPTFRRVWAAEDGMRLKDCQLSGGVFVAYLPKVEGNTITGYTEVEVKGAITYSEESPYPYVPFEDLGVQQNQVYKWVFTPADNGEFQAELDNYRFFGTFKPWDPDLTQSSAGDTGMTGENPPLPAYVLQDREKAPARPAGSAGAVALKPSTSTPAPDVTPTPAPEVTPTPAPEVTPTPAPEVTPTPAPEVTPTPAPEVTPTPAPDVTPTPAPDVTPTPAPEVTPSAAPSVTPTPVPEVTPTPAPEVTPSAAPSVTPSPTPGSRPGSVSRPSGGGSSSRPSTSTSTSTATTPAPAVLTDRPGGGKVLSLAQGATLTAEQSKTLAAANAKQPVKLDTAQGLRVFVPAGTLKDQGQVAGLLADVSQAKDGAVVVRTDAQGNRHVLSMALVQKGQVAYVADKPGQYALATPQSAAFTDTDQHWAKEAIAFTSARELTQGMTQSEFMPEESTSRAMVFTMLARMTGEDLPATQGQWYDSAVSWAMAQGLSDGDRPDSPVKRQELVTLLWRWAGKPQANADLTVFTDARDIDSYAQESMAWAVKVGILTGRPDATIDPRSGATRAETAAILQRFITHQVSEQTR